MVGLKIRNANRRKFFGMKEVKDGLPSEAWGPAFAPSLQGMVTDAWADGLP